MLKKTIKFTDLDGNEVTEDHYFHLSKADLIEMEVSQQGGMQTYISQIVDSKDGKKIIEIFKDLLRMSYGIRTAEGRFIRDPARTAEFMASEAYSELFMELVTDGTAASVFVTGIIPKGLDETAAQIQQSADAQAAARAQAEHEAKEDPTGLTNGTTSQVLTHAQMLEMDSDELKSGLATGRYKLAP